MNVKLYANCASVQKSCFQQDPKFPPNLFDSVVRIIFLSFRNCPHVNTALAQMFQCHLRSSVHWSFGRHLDVVSWFRLHHIQSIDRSSSYPRKVQEDDWTNAVTGIYFESQVVGSHTLATDLLTYAESLQNNGEWVNQKMVLPASLWGGGRALAAATDNKWHRHPELDQKLILFIKSSGKHTKYC